MKNLTIVAREEVLRWLRVRAAEENTSVSRLVGRWLEERMSEQERYEVAMREFLSTAPMNLSDGKPYPSRDELHDRAGLRDELRDRARLR